MNQALHGDCLELMRDVPTGSVDMILCDLPYGTTACKWDTIIPFAPLWEQYERIIKPKGAIVLTASQPFTSALVMSNTTLFKYSIIWDKVNSSSGLFAKFQPLRSHEDVLVFSNGKTNYNPQMVAVKKRQDKARIIPNGEAFNGRKIERVYSNNGMGYPKSILRISNADQKLKNHPTQKPVALFEYLIKTYTNEGETVMDNCAGSGTTAIACLNTNRNYIVMEKDPQYFQTITDRIAKWHEQNTQIKLAI